jgi:hypothetical protein
LRAVLRLLAATAGVIGVMAVVVGVFNAVARGLTVPVMGLIAGGVGGWVFAVLLTALERHLRNQERIIQGLDRQSPDDPDARRWGSPRPPRPAATGGGSVTPASRAARPARFCGNCGGQLRNAHGTMCCPNCDLLS